MNSKAEVSILKFAKRERNPTAHLPVLDPDVGIKRASDAWVGLRLVFAWSLAAVIGWGILAAGAWGLVYAAHWLWQSVTP
jgi:hypothetical protein